jgi:hypothetical protein
MDMPFKCRNCGSDKYQIRRVGPHKGIFCAECAAWEKWLDRKEYALLIRKPEAHENPTRNIFSDTD